MGENSFRISRWERNNRRVMDLCCFKQELASVLQLASKRLRADNRRGDLEDLELDLL